LKRAHRQGQKGWLRLRFSAKAAWPILGAKQWTAVAVPDADVAETTVCTERLTLSKKLPHLLITSWLSSDSIRLILHVMIFCSIVSVSNVSLLAHQHLRARPGRREAPMVLLNTIPGLKQSRLGMFAATLGFVPS
jgi:hypothetical protein